MLKHESISVEKHNTITDIFCCFAFAQRQKTAAAAAAAAVQATSYKEETIDLSLGVLFAHAPKWICSARPFK